MKKLSPHVVGRRFVVVFSLVSLLAGCCTSVPVSVAPAPKEQAADEVLLQRYEAAVADAQKIEPGKIDSHLTIVSPRNPDLVWDKDKKRILTAVYASCPDGTYYHKKKSDLMDVEDGVVIWVTVVPDLAHWCKAHGSSGSSWPLRLKELLGMPPGVKKDSIVELWVRPEDLVRPAFDPAVDHQMGEDGSSAFAHIGAPIDPNNPYYEHWFYKQYMDSYVRPAGAAERYPWTRLGYTYDWGAPDYPHVGLSEFVILGSNYRAGRRTQVEVNDIKPVEEYCKSCGIQ